MVSKNQKKLIRSLKLKKNRKANNIFVAEGIKVINDFLNAGLKLHNLFVLDQFVNFFENVAEEFVQEITNSELSQISFLNTPQKALALFEMPKPKQLNANNGLQIVLDGVQDPGNLGTIIRLCDWFGVAHLVCSKNTVDCFNEKVVQATMGSLSRVVPVYVNLEDYLQKTTLPIYGTFMNGDNVYKQNLPENAIIIMGNEANGISKTIESFVKNKVGIPKFGNLKKVESLNVATATSILLSEFKRNSL